MNQNGEEAFLIDDIIYSESDEGWALPCETFKRDDYMSCSLALCFTGALYADLEGKYKGLIDNINIDALS